MVAPRDPSRFVLALAGPGSNTGKTRLLVSLIRELSKSRPVAALKIATATPDHLCARTGLACGCLQFEGRMRLLTDPAYIERDGKDTAQLKAAGADPVWWLQTTSDFQIEATKEVLKRLEGPELWIVEGAGPIRAGLADLSLLLARRDGQDSKESFYELLPHADALVLSDREAQQTEYQVLQDLSARGWYCSKPRFSARSGQLPTGLIDWILCGLAEGHDKSST